MVALKYLIGLILFIGLWANPAMVFPCHQSKANTCSIDSPEHANKKQDCCHKAKKKPLCQHRKQCRDCSCHCAAATSILAVSTLPVQLPKISFSILKKLYRGLLPVYLSEGYFYPWVPPKIA
ncbi:hypothetical protein ACK8HY_04955 [Sphingobacterium sp. NGMCC 1.201703]|uniref:hypothetical protein n=1 Tax=unclassified Sphingobacterium TaxID=2609468 RepID=UPI001115509F|nr:hypothetical protein [Sphingobacterium sp. CZ-UAM]